MINKELIKLEIDKVKSEYLGLLYRIIKALEKGLQDDDVVFDFGTDKEKVLENNEWLAFIGDTYGCLSDSPILRGEQGAYEDRKAME